MSAISAQRLTKDYGSFRAVDAVEFDVTAGQCFGMLGPNGAGKTTTMSMIGCVTPMTSGELSVLGMDARTHVRKIKSRLGVVPQDDSLDDDLTVIENLVVYAGFFGIGRRNATAKAIELLEFMELGERRKSRVRELSGGMKRRLVIARALVNDPEMILLDEPTTGLDPQARQQIWERLEDLRSAGATLLLTTHYMEEAARLCDRLVIMDHARILVEGTPRDLIRAEIPRHVVELPLNRAPAGLIAGDSDVDVRGDRLLIHTNDSTKVIADLVDAGVDDTQILERMAGLEDVFLRLTGKGEL